MKVNFYFLLILMVLFFCNCSKKCECIMHNTDGYPIPDVEPIIKTMPYGLKLDCSFFEEYVDSLGRFKCM